MGLKIYKLGQTILEKKDTKKIKKKILQPLCRHVLRNQHKFIHFLQRQIRLCSSSTARPLEKLIDYDENVKIIDIPESAYETRSQTIEHERDTGHLFKVIRRLDSCIAIT